MLYKCCRYFLFLLSPETAHGLTLWAMKFLQRTKLSLMIKNKKKKPVTFNKINFDNPIGIAAGFDKTGSAIEATEALGFGFIEVGSFTPLPQIGNAKPRLFRIPKIKALINRMGLNNAGVDAAAQTIKSQNYSIPIGISLGKNNDSDFEQGIKDYLYGFEKMYSIANYFSIDISCPNVPDYKLFWRGENFQNLLTALKAKQLEVQKIHNCYIPVFIKVSPDLAENDVLNFCEVFNESGLDGVIATNTSREYRPCNIQDKALEEMGGLSGVPIFPKMLNVLKLLKANLKSEITLIAVGGIDSPEAAAQCFNAGANLIQIYTGLVYEGPGLVSKILKRLAHSNPATSL